MSRICFGAQRKNPSKMEQGTELVSLVVARLPHRWSDNDCAVWDSTAHNEYNNYVKAVLSVGKVLGAYWPGRGTGREPASCAGGRENSVALQVP